MGSSAAASLEGEEEAAPVAESRPREHSSAVPNVESSTQAVVFVRVRFLSAISGTGQAAEL